MTSLWLKVTTPQDLTLSGAITCARVTKQYNYVTAMSFADITLVFVLF